MLKLVLVGLAAYRLAKLITMEDGPFNVALKVREAAFRRFDETHWINKGLSCPYCVSFWLALGLLFVPSLSPLWGEIVLIWLAAAGLASLAFAWEFRS